MTRAHEGTEQHLLNEIPETVSVDVLGGTARRDSEHKTKTTPGFMNLKFLQIIVIGT